MGIIIGPQRNWSRLLRSLKGLLTEDSDRYRVLTNKELSEVQPMKYCSVKAVEKLTIKNVTSLIKPGKVLMMLAQCTLYPECRFEMIEKRIVEVEG